MDLVSEIKIRNSVYKSGCGKRYMINSNEPKKFGLFVFDEDKHKEKLYNKNSVNNLHFK